MLNISTYTHICCTKDILKEDHWHRQAVDAWEYETDRTCDYCGKQLVTTEQLLAHIYRELTE